MKKILFIIFGLTLVFSLSISAKNSKSINGNKDFHHSFRHAKNVHKFEKENGTVEFDFLLKGKYVAAFYDQTGKLTETDFSIVFKELPEKTKNYIQTEFQNPCITDITKVRYSQNTFYRIKLEKNGIEYSILSTLAGEITIGY